MSTQCLYPSVSSLEFVIYGCKRFNVAIHYTVASISSFCVGRYVAKRQKSWMEATEKRVNLTTELFGSIKAIKMLGLSKMLSHVVQATRVTEVDLSKGYRKLSVTNTCLSKPSNLPGRQKV